MRAIRTMPVLALLLLAATPARAMGFGAPVLKSHLNEPLKLILPIELSRSERLSRIFVELASKREYRELGLEPPTHRAAIRVSLEQGPNGRPQASFDSTGPVSDPVLSLLVKARSGRMTYFKHFEVMLDPPPGERPPPGRLASTLVRAEHENAPQTAPARSSWARVDRYGPVRSGDSLSEIAYRLRKDKRYSNRQVMLALYDANPDAFISGDINRLKNGAWLRVPGAREVERHAGRAAMQRLARLLRPSPAPAAKPPAPSRQAAGNPPANREPVAAQVAEKAASSHPPAFRGKVGLGDADAEIAARIARERREQLLLEQLKTMSLMFEQSREQERRMQRSLSGLEGYVRNLERSVADLRAEIRARQTANRAWIIGLLLLLALTLAAFALVLYRQHHARPESVAPDTPTTITPQMPEPEPEPIASLDDEPEPPFPARTAPALDENELAIQSLIDRIEEALHRRRPDEAEAALDELDGLAPKHLRGRALRAEWLFRSGRRDECRELVDSMRHRLDARRWHLFSGMLSRDAWHFWEGHDGPHPVDNATTPPDNAETAGPGSGRDTSDDSPGLDLTEMDMPELRKRIDDKPEAPANPFSETIILQRKETD